MAEPDRTLQVRWINLGAVYLVVGTVSAVALRWWQSSGGNLPMISALLAVLLLAVAVTVVLLGLRVRRWVGRGDRIDPLGATRTLVLGQAAAVTGAILAGYLTASLVLALLGLPAPEPRSVATGSALGLTAAVVTAVAGMVAQWCCRVPPEDDDEPPALG